MATESKIIAFIKNIENHPRHLHVYTHMCGRLRRVKQVGNVALIKLWVLKDFFLLSLTVDGKGELQAYAIIFRAGGC